MNRFSVPPTIPSVGDGAGDPMCPPYRVSGRFSPSAKRMVACCVASSIAAVSSIAAAHCLVFGETESIQLYGFFLCSGLACAGVAAVMDAVRKNHRDEEEQAEVIAKVCANYEADLASERMEYMLLEEAYSRRVGAELASFAYDVGPAHGGKVVNFKGGK